MPNGASTKSVKSTWVALRPISTVRVRLPTSRSWSMSRRLLASSTAQANRPVAIAPSQACCGRAKICTQVVPSVATSPKKTKTNTSPKP